MTPRPRLVCAICGAEAVWLEDAKGRLPPRCPYHPRQTVFRGLRAGEEWRPRGQREMWEER